MNLYRRATLRSFPKALLRGQQASQTSTANHIDAASKEFEVKESLRRVRYNAEGSDVVSTGFVQVIRIIITINAVKVVTIECQSK